MKPLDEFGRDASRPDGHRFYCRPCQRRLDYERAHGLRPLRPRRAPAAERDGDARQARNRIARLVRSGVLPSATSCVCAVCSSQAAGYAHASYASGEHTHVEPLCSFCLAWHTRRRPHVRATR